MQVDHLQDAGKTTFKQVEKLSFRYLPRQWSRKQIYSKKMYSTHWSQTYINNILQ